VNLLQSQLLGLVHALDRMGRFPVTLYKKQLLRILACVMGVVQFERELIRERQREGIAIAKREGKHTAGNRL